MQHGRHSAIGRRQDEAVDEATQALRRFRTMRVGSPFRRRGRLVHRLLAFGNELLDEVWRLKESTCSGIMRKSDLPRQIAQQIPSDIAAGALKPGDHVPARRVLADRFGVSRSPIRIVLELLAEQAFLEQRQRKGCFVVSDPPSDAAGGPGQMFDDGRMSDDQRLADDRLSDRIPTEGTAQAAPARTPSALRNPTFEAVRWLYGSKIILHRILVYIERP